MELVEIVAQGSLKAAATLAGLQPQLKGQEALLCECLKKALQAKLGECRMEWKSALEANLHESWLREMLNAQCWTIARAAVDECRATLGITETVGNA